MEELIITTYLKWQEAKRYAAKACRATKPELAQQLDDCRMFTGVEDLADLVALMFKPQGYEFMLANRFPTIATLRKFKQYNPEQYGVYIDCGVISLSEPRNVFLIGNTVADIFINQTANNTIILMHGAGANVFASGSSVTRIEKDRKSWYEVSKSANAIVL